MFSIRPAADHGPDDSQDQTAAGPLLTQAACLERYSQDGIYNCLFVLVVGVAVAGEGKGRGSAM